MASAAEGGGRSTVRRHLWVLVAANLLVVVGVGVFGIIGAIRANSSVHYLTESVEPAIQSNAAVLKDLTDAETYLWGWTISSDPILLTQYRVAVELYEQDRAQLEELSLLDSQVALLVDDFLLAADDWFAAYVEPRLAEQTGPQNFDARLFERGRRLFGEVRRTNAAVAANLQQLSREADRSSRATVRNIVVVLMVVLVAGAAASSLVGRRIARRVTEPLGELERTAHLLAGGQHDARAPVRGPREMVQVAAAINTMADENDRARAVETRVVEQLRALDAVRSDFVSNVSHELRTPLTSILGYLELLEEEVHDHAGDSEREMIAAAKRNVLRLGELIDDLLALTRSEGERTDLETLDLALLVRDIITDLRVASASQGVEIRLGLPGKPVLVRADSGQLARVVTNLVSNAVKFSQGASEVVVTVLAVDADAVLTVEDHGIGIPDEEMDQLGSRFYRASNAVGMGITGTGLGLRIVQAIVENHHGSVDLRSEQGVGTTVWVRIPLEVAAAREVDPAAPSEVVG